MAAPTVPTWDSNGTNISAITSGHSSDGWATNEVVTSAELNDYMRKVYLCLAYLITTRVLEGDYEFTDDVTIDGELKFTTSRIDYQPPRDALLSNMTTADQVVWSNTGSSAYKFVSQPFRLREGDRVSLVKVYCRSTVGIGQTVTLKKVSTVGAVSTIQSWSIPGSITGVVVDNTVTSPYTLTSSDAYVWVEVTGTETLGTGGEAFVGPVGATYTHP